MNPLPSDTPETDRELHAVQHGTSRFSFPAHARRMERERDAVTIVEEIRRRLSIAP